MLEETKKSIDEDIKLIEAFKNGETIEYRDVSEWFEITSYFNLLGMLSKGGCMFRIKEKPKIRPYKNQKEFLIAMKKHGPYLKAKDNTIRCYGQYTLPIIIKNDTTKDKSRFVLGSMNPAFYDFDNLLNWYIWQDGTKCGFYD